jgi:hypothetical protein
MKHKLLSVLLIISAVAAAYSCKKDVKANTSLIGKWETVSEKQKQWENDKLINETVYPYEKGELIAEFRADNTITITKNGVLSSEIIPYSIMGKIIIIDGEESEFNLTDSNNTLTIMNEQVEVSNGVTYRYEFATTLKRL